MAPDQQNPSVGLADLGKTVQNLAAQFVELFEQIGRAVESAKKIFLWL